MKIHVEIFIVSRILGKNQTSFSPEDLIRFIQKEFDDSRPGIMTHATAVCVANAHLNHALGYNYLWRSGHADLRPFRPGIDKPDPEREKHQTQPKIEDVPGKISLLIKNAIDPNAKYTNAINLASF